MDIHTDDQKIKILICGSNSPHIDAFFTRVENVDCFTSSSRVADFENHLKYIHPDAVLLPIKGMARDAIPKLAPLREGILSNSVPVAVYGARDELSSFEELVGFRPDISVEYPQLATNVVRIIQSFLEPSMRKATDELIEATERKRHHVLVIDDDVTILRTIRSVLELDYEVATATSGRQAYRFFSDNTTDCILLDYNMPVEMGDQVFKTLRSRSKTARIPIIFLTGTSDMTSVKNLLALKPQGYLVKPVEANTLLEHLEGLLEG